MSVMPQSDFECTWIVECISMWFEIQLGSMKVVYTALCGKLSNDFVGTVCHSTPRVCSVYIGLWHYHLFGQTAAIDMLTLPLLCMRARCASYA